MSMTDLFSFKIPYADSDEAVWAVTEICGDMGLYPIQYKECKGKGVILTFLRNPAVASYVYREKLLQMAEKLKLRLHIGSVLIKNNTVKVDRNNLPEEIRFCRDLSASSEEDAKDLKNLSDDEMVSGKAYEAFKEEISARDAREKRKREQEENIGERAEAFAIRKKGAKAKPAAVKKEEPKSYVIEQDDYLLEGQLHLVFSI